MVRVGLFGTFDGDDAVIATVLRAELARRMPGLELRTYTPGGDPEPSGIAEPVTWSDQPLGSFGAGPPGGARRHARRGGDRRSRAAGPRPARPCPPVGGGPGRVRARGARRVVRRDADGRALADRGRSRAGRSRSARRDLGRRVRCPPAARRPRRDDRPGGAAPGPGAAPAPGGGGHAAGGRAPPRRRPPSARRLHRARGGRARPGGRRAFGYRAAVDGRRPRRRDRGLGRLRRRVADRDARSPPRTAGPPSGPAHRKTRPCLR